MPIINRNIFSRPMRMVHHFQEGSDFTDPVKPNHAFNAPFPIECKQQRSPPLEIQQYGEHRSWDEPKSAIIKPTGRRASLNGPDPDYAADFAGVFPPSTKKRVGHKSTDK